MGRKSRFFHNYHGVICMATCALMSGNLHAAPSTSSNPFSQYGLIQGVRNYSSNPFWSPDAPYNMRMPVPVYVNGPDINTGECQTVVANLVAGTCAALNNCRGTRLSDIRPSVMLALSRMPGNRNYATACMGYIDTAYSEYMKLNTDKLDSSARFPTYAIANPAANTASVSTTTSAAPKWQTEMDARAAELESFHSQTTDPASLGSVPFPTTYADVPFEKRIENEKLGYEPFKDAKAYHEIKLEDAAKAKARYDAAVKAQDQATCNQEFSVNPNLNEKKVSYIFCKQCRAHKPYDEFCAEKDELMKRDCTEWCKIYGSEDTQFCDDCKQENETLKWCNEEYKDGTKPHGINFADPTANEKCKEVWQKSSTYLGPWCDANIKASYVDQVCRDNYWTKPDKYTEYCNATDPGCTVNGNCTNAGWTEKECRDLWNNYDHKGYCDTHWDDTTRCDDPCDKPTTYRGDPNNCKNWGNVQNATYCERKDINDLYKIAYKKTKNKCAVLGQQTYCDQWLFDNCKYTWCKIYYPGEVKIQVCDTTTDNMTGPQNSYEHCDSVVEYSEPCSTDTSGDGTANE